ncbi:MAG TPA: glycosyltransferase [Aliarcobacter thereius]|nr:glycosyltransferase [Aliarcobacter thereius]HJE03302.1 glycosyltransferase [Aliarcobacter thereius]
MKISYITMQFPVPSETFASLDVNALLDLGNKIDVYSLRPQHKEYNQLMNQRHKNCDNLNIKHLDFLNFVMALIFMICNPFKLFTTIKWIFKANSNPKDIIKSIVLLPSIFYIYSSLERSKPDMVHLFWGHYPSMLLYLLQKYMPDVPFTMFLGAHDLETRYQGSVVMSHHANKVFTHSYDNVEALISIGIKKDKIEVLHRGTLVNDKILNKVKEKKFRIDEITFLTASRLIKEKGIDEVIDIFASFVKKYPKSKLFIAGDGPYKDTLQKQAQKCSLKESIVFLGHVSQDELFNYMNRVDFFILMSRYKAERLPNVLKEAMLRKCICITTYTTGIEELVKNEQNGFIFETKEQVWHFLNSIDYQNNSLEEIARNGQETIVESFNVYKTMQSYLEIWENIIEGKNNAK